MRLTALSLKCLVACVILSSCIIVHADGIDDTEASFARLRRAFEPLGAFVHPGLTLKHSTRVNSNGLQTTQPLSSNTTVLDVPNHLALTNDVAWESIAPLLTAEQTDTIQELQAETCGLVDWFLVIYVAYVAAQRDHPVLSKLDQPIPSVAEQSSMIEAIESNFVDRHVQCPAFFFPVYEDQSFDSRMHGHWAKMIDMYPPTCTSLVCQPMELPIDLLNTPLLLDQHHQHIDCLVSTHMAVDGILETLHSTTASRLPILSYELLLWATSMVISRQQSMLTVIEPKEGVHPVAALIPFFDLFNSHPTAFDSTSEDIYRSEFKLATKPNPKTHAPQPGVQAIVNGAKKAGSELFDLYGGGHPSTNVDLLSYFGFATLDLPTDSLSLIFAVCTDFSSSTPLAKSELKPLFDLALDEMEKLYQDAPLAVDELWSEQEHAKYSIATKAGSSEKDYYCDHGRMFQSSLTPQGVAITLPVLSRLAVMTPDDLKNQELTQKVLHGDSVLSRTQERLGLLLLLHWLRLASEAASTEWVDLRCNKKEYSFDTFPEIPELTEEETSGAILPVDLMWRHANPEASAFLRHILELDELAQSQTSFLFHPQFHQGLCILKTNHIRLLVNAANRLAKLL